MNESIKNLREQSNFSQQKLAEILGVSRQMYIKYENGDVEPPVKIVRELCNLYNVSYESIIDDRLAPKKVSYEERINRFEEESLLSVAQPSLYTDRIFHGRGYSNPLSDLSVSAVVEAVSNFSQQQKEKIMEVLGRKSEIKAKRLKALEKYAGSCGGLWPLNAVEYQTSLREDR